MTRRTLTTTEAGPLDRRVVTAREAEEMLGIPAGSIRAWKSQERLFVVSVDANGENWFRLADVLELRVRHAVVRRIAGHLGAGVI